MSNKAFKVNQSLLLKPNTTEPASPQNGELYYDSASNKFKFRQNNEWAELGGGVGGVDIIHVQTAEDAALADFIQNGLEIIASPIILHGLKSFRLIHQASGARDFKDIILVDRKFRGKNVTFELDVVSSAESSNLTVLFRDETPGQEADIVPSQIITTDSQSITATVTSGSPTLNGMDTTTFNKLKLGMLITGPGIPSGTRIDALSIGTLSATLSQNATTTNSSSKKISSLTTKRKFTFNLKDNCSQFSYKISALQEINSPETYIDDIIIQLTEYAKSTASIIVPKNNNYRGVPYSPTVLGTTNAVANLTYARQEDRMLISGNITWVGTAASAAAPGFVLPLSLNTLFPAGTILTSAIANDAGVDNYISLIRVDTSNTIYVHSHGTTGSNTALRGNLPFTPNAGDVIRFAFELPIQEWNVAEKEVQQIPLTSSVLVTEPDSYLQMNGFSVAAGSSATRVLSLASPTYTKSEGNAIKYVKDSVNGDYIEALLDGQYHLVFNYDSNLASTTNAGLGFSKNSNQLSTEFQSINPEHQLSLSYSLDVARISWSGPLKSGDKVRIHSGGNHLASYGTVYSQFSVSYQGSTKILNPSSDQKVEIPTHELIFEGASSRGSTDSIIVKFDNISKIKGDGFTVTNNTANGTFITIKKKGRLNVSSGFLSPNANQNIYISINQTVLTATPVAGQVVNWGSNGVVNTILSTSGTVDVVEGDIIRIACTSNPVADGRNFLSLSLQEQSVAVALQNVTPRWDDSDTSVRISRSNGETISAVTDNIRFSSLDNVIGTGAYFNTNGFITTESGIFTLNAVVLCTTTATRGVDVYVNGSFYRRATDSLSSDTFNVNLTDYFPANSYITLRFAGNGATLSTANSGHWFTISKVGKTQGTVDVTPFVNMRTHENIVGEVIAFAGSAIPENFLLCDGRAVSRATYAALFNVIGTSHGSGDGSTTFNIPDYRGRFLRGVDGTAGNDPDKASRTAMNTGGNTGNNVGSVQADQFASHTHNYTTNATISQGSPGSANQLYLPNTDAGATTANGGNETRPKNAYVNYIIRFAKDQMGIATPTEQVSSDTIPFVFKATAIDPNVDPIGTFNTFLYSINTNTAVIQSTAPTQTTSSMNLNGVQVFGRAYNAAGTTGQPNRVDIFIGKGLKSHNLDCYYLTGKSGADWYDVLTDSSGTVQRGTYRSYSETTGILTLDAGSCVAGTETIRLATRSQVSGYFVFNASKSPSLVSIPNLQQKVAILTDVKPNGTDGGTSVSTTYVTRALNTLNDPNGIVTSLASNQFTLPAGQYHIEASAPAYVATNHRIRLRNITDSATAILGTSEYTASTMNVMSRSFISDTITIGSSKTFEIQHYVQTGNGGNGLGVRVNSSEQEIYTTVKITKIK